MHPGIKSRAVEYSVNNIMGTYNYSKMILLVEANGFPVDLN